MSGGCVLLCRAAGCLPVRLEGAGDQVVGCGMIYIRSAVAAAKGAGHGRRHAERLGCEVVPPSPAARCSAGGAGRPRCTGRSAPRSGRWTGDRNRPDARPAWARSSTSCRGSRWSGRSLNALAQDAAGNNSSPTSATVDSLAPAAPVIDPSNGSVIAGTAEAGATVILTDGNGNPIGQVTAGTRLRTERSEVRILLSAPYFEGFLSSGARRAKDRQLRSFTVKQALPAGGRKKHRHALIAQLDRVDQDRQRPLPLHRLDHRPRARRRPRLGGDDLHRLALPPDPESLRSPADAQHRPDQRALLAGHHRHRAVHDPEAKKHVEQASRSNKE